MPESVPESRWDDVPKTGVGALLRALTLHLLFHSVFSASLLVMILFGLQQVRPLDPEDWYKYVILFVGFVSIGVLGPLFGGVRSPGKRRFALILITPVAGLAIRPMLWSDPLFWLYIGILSSLFLSYLILEGLLFHRFYRIAYPWPWYWMRERD